MSSAVSSLSKLYTLSSSLLHSSAALSVFLAIKMVNTTHSNTEQTIATCKNDPIPNLYNTTAAIKRLAKMTLNSSIVKSTAHLPPTFPLSSSSGASSIRARVVVRRSKIHLEDSHDRFWAGMAANKKRLQAGPIVPRLSPRQVVACWRCAFNTGQGRSSFEVREEVRRNIQHLVDMAKLWSFFFCKE